MSTPKPKRGRKTARQAAPSTARTTARQSLAAAEELEIKLSPTLAAYVRDAHSTGLYGVSLGETVDRLICESLQGAIATGLITLRRRGVTTP